MLANTYEVTNTNSNGSGSLSQALSSATSHAGPDIILFKSSVGGQMFPATSVFTPVMIRSEGAAVNIAGLYFSGFVMPASSSVDEVGVKNVRISNVSVGIHVNNIAPNSIGTGDSAAFVVKGVDLLDNTNGIRVQNSDIPFRFEENVITGTGGALTGIGIEIQSTSENTLPSVIGDYGATASGLVFPVGTGNLISEFGTGISIAGSFPALRISGNTIGAFSSPFGSTGPNGAGIVISNSSPGPDSVSMKQLDRIDNNTINANITTGVSVSRADAIRIDHNTISDNGGKGVHLAVRSGDHTIEQNTFDNNGNDAIAMQPGQFSGDWPRSVRISQNNFLRTSTSPGVAPIDLNDDGPSLQNDNDDNDEGVNNLQNYPDFEATGMYLQGSTWKVPVQLDSLAAGSYRLQFYKYNPSLNSYTYLKEQNITKLGGSIPFRGEIDFTNGTQLSAGERLAALVIDEAGASAVPASLIGSTSEMSPVVSVDQFLPRIVDVRIDGTSWIGNSYSFAPLVGQGLQLRPVSLQNANQIQIQFTEHVRKRLANGTVADIASTAADGNLLLQLNSTVRAQTPGAVPYDTLINTQIVAASSFTYDPVTFTATWTFPTLVEGKYAIHLAAGGGGKPSVVDAANNALDGEWDNVDGGTPDFGSNPTKTFGANMGNGTPGSTDSDLDGDEEFRFHFALLPGDYNGDGIVTLADASSLADGNGDGIVNASDDSVRVAHMNYVLPLKGLGGADFADDEIVDGADRNIWLAAYGYNANGDATGNGNSNDDFIYWQAAFGKRSVWRTGPSEAIPAIVSEEPVMGLPKVTNVIVSGSASLHAPFSFDAVDGSGSQLQTVPVGGADTISIVFSEPVNVAANSLLVTGLQTFNLPTLASFAYDVSTNTATWQFQGWSLGDQYLLALSDEVTDVEGNWLDGEWTNPAARTTANALVSEFPSGDNQPGGWFNFVMTLLPGDADLNGVVTGPDFSILSVNYNISSGRLFTQGDFNGDGATNIVDYSMLSSNWGRNLQSLAVRADLDGDWDVDESDLAAMRANYGLTGMTWSDGDLDGDGTVDEDDFDLAFAQFGLSLSVVS